MGFIDRSWEYQRIVEDKVTGLTRGKYGRVLRMARKPSKEEYLRTTQIVGVGLAVLGIIGFLIYWVWLTAPGLLIDSWQSIFGG